MGAIIQKKRLYAELVKINLSLPPRKPDSELRAISEIFFEELSGKSEIHIVAALGEIRRKAQFFPVLAEILTEYNLIIGRVQDNRNLLPESTSQYLSREENKRRAQELKRSLKRIKSVPFEGLNKAQKRAHRDRILKQRDDINEGRDAMFAKNNL